LTALIIIYIIIKAIKTSLFSQLLEIAHTLLNSED